MNEKVAIAILTKMRIEVEKGQETIETETIVMTGTESGVEDGIEN